VDLELKELAVGVIVAIVVLLAFRVANIHRERGSYAVLLVGVAAPYLMFAIETHEPDELKHAIIGLIFVAIAIMGARWNLWIIVAGFIAHGIFNAVLQLTPLPAPTPGWYGPFCFWFDFTIAAGLAGFLAQGRKLSDMT